MKRDRTACFSGYRPEKFSFPLTPSCPEYRRLRETISGAIDRAVADGYTDFLCGMAKGFDLLCGDILLEMRPRLSIRGAIRLVAVRPFAEHRVSGHWRALYDFVSEEADQVLSLAPRYERSVYLDRNLFMVEHSSLLICYSNSKSKML